MNDEPVPPPSKTYPPMCTMLVPTITAVAMPSSSTTPADPSFVITGVDFVGTGLKSGTDIGSSDTRARSDAAALSTTEATTGKFVRSFVRSLLFISV